MKIKIAREIGYCYGVRDAVDATVDAAKGDNNQVYTLGQIIHNPQTIEMLEKHYHVKNANSPEEIPENSTVIVRTHGATKENVDKLRNNGLNVIDATCPFVLKTHKIVKELVDQGYHVVIFGHKSHPEVIGIRGQIEGQCTIVEAEKDLDGINWNLKLAAVFQSTVTYNDFKWAMPILAAKCYDLKILKTICEVTITRQKYTNQVAKEVDAMVVIGGKNSSNTKKLVEMCQQYVKTFHIDGKDELNSLDLSWAKSVGVSSGTSTPDFLVQEIVDSLKSRYNATVEIDELAE